MTVEQDSTDLIRIWKYTAAPATYRALFPSASESYWIALVPSKFVWEFTQQLCVRKSSDTDTIQVFRLPDGATVFCGPLETE